MISEGIPIQTGDYPDNGAAIKGGQRLFSKRFLGFVAVCALPLVALPLIELFAVSSFGSRNAWGFQMLLYLPFLGAAAVVVVAPFLLIFRKLRRSATQALIAAVVYIATVILGEPVGRDLRMSAFHRLAERSKTLVEAITAYESRYGAPPSELPALVPEFLPSIPSTGMRAYPAYEYYVGEQATRYGENPWALVVSTPKGLINWDIFMYFPRQNYPKTGFGGVVQRVEDWAYVFE